MGGLAALGAHSYSIYLWNLPVRYWVTPLIERALGPSVGFGAHAAIYLIGSLAVGVAMAKLIEIPALRMRDRWIPSRSRGPIQDRGTDASPASGAAGRHPRGSRGDHRSRSRLGVIGR